MKNTLITLLFLFAFSIFGIRISKRIVFKQNVTGYLKRAADANTIALANEELSRAITYLEEHNLTSGYTSILYKTPDEDIDFWYRNLKASQNELQTLNSDSPLEKTNVLIKLRETLLDTGEKTKVTVPKGISVYPDHKLWAALVLAAFLALLIGAGMLTTKLEQNQKTDTDK